MTCCLYQYNGQDFLGRSALGQSVGMNESLTHPVGASDWVWLAESV